MHQEKRNELLKEYRCRQWDLFIGYAQDYLEDHKILDALNRMLEYSVMKEERKPVPNETVFERGKQEVSCPILERLELDMCSGNRSARSSDLYQTAGCQSPSAASRPWQPSSYSEYHQPRKEVENFSASIPQKREDFVQKTGQMYTAALLAARNAEREARTLQEETGDQSRQNFLGYVKCVGSAVLSSCHV